MVIVGMVTNIFLFSQLATLNVIFAVPLMLLFLGIAVTGGWLMGFHSPPIPHGDKN